MHQFLLFLSEKMMSSEGETRYCVILRKYMVFLVFSVPGFRRGLGRKKRAMRKAAWKG
ncbi:hypothetical protein RD1_3046 [Roseobacter denitrificans OCh 114]|uniref:Uncharacterized protein n=1 Tax=Roseobacter denitrificans (strain ATCC 33942 / OCh 114) TaxID=375451 RepID=Q164N4_ROSDO|nr:hypothetical protein RD1_3046 [Roseobacter denitrificans OCh 114]